MPGARAQQRSGGGLTSVHIWLIVFVVLWLASTVAFVVLLTGQEALTNQNTDLLTENNLLITLAEKNELSRYRDRTGPGVSMIGVVEKERQDTVALITGSGLDDLATARTKQSGLVQQLRSDGLVEGVNPDDALLTMLDRFRANYRGKRFSFGYPACPDLALQEPLFELIDPREIGIALTEGFMMEPEAAVSAAVFHHPDAKYFSVR